MSKRDTEPTFIVRLIAPGIEPSKIAYRLVNAAISAVQDLASGRDPLETRQVPDEKLISLVNVRKGSALYSCISRAPSEAKANLKLVGQMLGRGEGDTSADERLAKVLLPVEKLSEVAKALDGRVEVALASNPREPLFGVGSGDFARISARLFLTGETTVVGTVKRVGGHTDMKCALSVPGRRRLLFCDVRDKPIVRRLGEHLYEDISAKGEAVWIYSSWHIYKFTIHDFAQPSIRNISTAIADLRRSGLSAWDNVREPDKLLGEIRK